MFCVLYRSLYSFALFAVVVGCILLISGVCCALRSDLALPVFIFIIFCLRTYLCIIHYSRNARIHTLHKHCTNFSLGLSKLSIDRCRSTIVHSFFCAWFFICIFVPSAERDTYINPSTCNEILCEICL